MSDKYLTGKVVKLSSDKTVKVQIDVIKKHDLYKKYLKRNVNFLVHDEKSIASLNDIVEITPCKPYSKNKTWRLVSVIKD